LGFFDISVGNFESGSEKCYHGDGGIVIVTLNGNLMSYVNDFRCQGFKLWLWVLVSLDL